MLWLKTAAIDNKWENKIFYINHVETVCASQKKDADIEVIRRILNILYGK